MDIDGDHLSGYNKVQIQRQVKEMDKRNRQRNRVETYTVVCPWCKATYLREGHRPAGNAVKQTACTNCGYKGPSIVK